MRVTRAIGWRVWVSRSSENEICQEIFDCLRYPLPLGSTGIIELGGNLEIIYGAE